MIKIFVYGAYGHTGRFVVADLLERGLQPVLSGRDGRRLQTLADEHPGLEAHPASLDSLALPPGIVAVVNCAGPFGDTPPPLLDAALRAGVHYLDVAGEALVALRTLRTVHPAGPLVVTPAVGFFGGLGDLLATAAFGDRADADSVTLTYAVDSWVPTRGSERTGELRAAVGSSTPAGG